MLRADYCPYSLIFKETAVTSRDVMSRKDTYLLRLWDDSLPEVKGIGEIAMFRGLSAEDDVDFEANMVESLTAFCHTGIMPVNMSSLIFGIETAMQNLKHDALSLVFPSRFTSGEKSICINGLIWMGDFQKMMCRLENKIDEGFRCIKIKIGGIDFNDELRLLQYIRKRLRHKVLTIRLDANGSFSRLSQKESVERLKRLSDFDVHSIEQPFSVREKQRTAEVVALKIIPIALDEQLIGVRTREEKDRILNEINPDYIILKPSLCGGFAHSMDWIELADSRGVGWWVTSALESAIGLNAIAQWTASVGVRDFPQGLGTGELYVNDFPSPLIRKGEWLKFSDNGYSTEVYDKLMWKDVPAI